MPEPAACQRLHEAREQATAEREAAEVRRPRPSPAGGPSMFREAVKAAVDALPDVPIPTVEQMALAVLRWYDVVLQIAEEPKNLMPDYGSWVRRRDHLTAEVMLLMRDGLLAAAVDMCVITEAGLAAYLASAQRAEQKAQDALGAAHREAAATLASLNKPSGPEGAL